MISVAMTTYNGAAYVEEQLRSILGQTVPVDEIVVCDDGSSDDTCAIIRRLADSRVRLWRNPENLGYIENFYQAISRTTGDYIFLADQDDRWAPDKVEKTLARMQSGGFAAVCTDFRLIDAEGMPLADKSAYQINPFIRRVKTPEARITTLRLAFGNIAQGCTYCFTKEVRDVYLRLHNREVIHDYQIMLIASCVGKAAFLKEELIDYRLHGHNSIGFSQKNRRIAIKTKASREPFMYRFFRQLNELVPVPHLFFYRALYYLRIPYLVAIVRRKLLAE